MGARRCYKSCIGLPLRGAVAQLGARLDGIEEVVGSNPIGSTKDSPLWRSSFISLKPIDRPLLRRPDEELG